MDELKKEAVKISRRTVLGVLLLTVLMLSACKSNSGQQSPKDWECGMENCHGLDISCGQNIPEVCTEEYQLGDFCRRFAVCNVVNGQCQLNEDELFGQCKACADSCKGLPFQKIFECESECKKKFE